MSALSPVGGNLPSQNQAKPQSNIAPPIGPASATLVSSITAALKEATETAAQTAQEAGKGDLQAQRLLQKEIAAKNSLKVNTTTESTSTTTNSNGQVIGKNININV